MSNKKEHFLYLVKTSELKLMTESEAARLALMERDHEFRHGTRNVGRRGMRRYSISYAFL